ncbi:3-hydroxyacyl-CoA dehydrogenase [Croceicoccus estronivorus]|uniref:SDR family NAD(P)-dependent oxidoreductase n=1 Tax=Croceicoccus estronivorus TaxID=1172626 RepID=UPI000829909C|nr:SDR family NAD(P)-dependent oxidoreductase [Croceicoccus estronivorus]OCC23540.1 3-hydroxyacyl-CoA dehydrogenase [Croceicoccus estronivorus]
MDFTDQVVIVTGGGRGLGRSHALAFSRAGARVVVVDLPGESDDPAADVVGEIHATGGQALVNHASVTDRPAIDATVADVLSRWGRIDALVNNAGILRDRSFAKLGQQDFSDVIDVHLTGAFNCTQAVWDPMRERNYGRIVMTGSASGLFGNFGQSNYGAAKMAQIGLMQTLGIEGAKADIRVNSLVPSAATRMTADILSPDMLDALSPDLVSPAALFLASRDAPNRCMLIAGAGSFEVATISMSRGIHLTGDPSTMADQISARFDEICDPTDAFMPSNAMEPPEYQLGKRASALNLGSGSR